MNSDEKKCSHCKRTFLISTHFQSLYKPETTKMCKLCRNRFIKYKNKPTCSYTKRRNIYLSHKKKKIEKSRGCEWPSGCRFNFSAQSETFLVCAKVENIVIFEFDHLPQKEKLFSVSNWIQYSKKYNEHDLITEISKCRILCAFHHKIHSHNQRTEKKIDKSDYSDTNIAVQIRKSRQKKYELVNDLKLFGGANKKFGKCEMCERPVLEGETSGFDFDHIDPTKKYHGISYLVQHNFSWENTIRPEIDKCRLLCANCHGIHTQAQNMQSKNENVTIVCRKRKRYLLPQNKEELEIRAKGEHPTKEELYPLVLKYSFSNVGKIYGVDPRTIVYWCKKTEIPHKRRKLMEILDET